MVPSCPDNNLCCGVTAKPSQRRRDRGDVLFIRIWYDKQRVISGIHQFSLLFLTLGTHRRANLDTLAARAAYVCILVQRY